MPRSYYDAVVLGGTLGALSAGALLARRGFRVTVLGQGVRGPTYPLGGLSLPRRLGALSCAESPAFRRVFAELALLPAARRRVVPLSPGWQAVLPRHRLDLGPSPERTLPELLREFPALQRPIEDFNEVVCRADRLADGLFGEDLAWPPQGFFERRRARRWFRGSPFGDSGVEGDLLAEFSETHPFRALVEAQARFATASDPRALTAFARARLHASGLRAVDVSDGTEGLTALLGEKIQQHGGDLRPRDRAERLLIERGRVRGVRLAGTDEELGCAFVLSPLDAAATLSLAGIAAPAAYAAQLSSATPALHRYIVNAVLPAEALPVGMGPRVFMIGDPARPLVEENLVAIETTRPDPQGRVVLTASALLPTTSVEEGADYLSQTRARVLSQVRELVAFFERNVMLVDSPHDGLPSEVHAPSLVSAARAGVTEPMQTLNTGGRGALGLFGLSPRTPIDGVYLVNGQTCPALGMEGELLTALTVARVVTRSDRTRERMRRELWSKVEV